jgi:CRISPR/Cas system endoribonuclease Cas6 (RAMP superfamily)
MLPQLVYAVQLMGESGIGTGRSSRFKMGRFTLEKVCTEQQTIFTGDKGVLHKTENIPQLQLDQQDLTDMTSVQVDILTPLRLKQGNKLKRNLPFHTLIRTGLRRIAALEEAYNDGEPEIDYRGLVERAGKITIQKSQLRWQQLFRWSNRQKKIVSLSGLGGTITYQGNLTEFMPILHYCEQVNIGKQTAFGLGEIEVHAPTSSP